MYDWFYNINSEEVMGFLNIHHILGLSICAFSVILLIKNKDKLIENPKLEEKVRYTLATISLISLILLRIYELKASNGRILQSMPFHFCSFAYMFGIYAMYTKHRKISEIAYFMGFIGGTSALLFPGIKMGFPYYRYLEYFFSHSMLILFMVYFLVIDGLEVNKNDRKKFVIYMVILSIPMIIWNERFNTQYFFLNGRVPNGWGNFIPEWPLYYPVLLVMIYIGAIWADMIQNHYSRRQEIKIQRQQAEDDRSGIIRY